MVRADLSLVMRQKKVQAIVTGFLQQEILCPYYTLLETERDRERQRETERDRGGIK